MKSDIQTLKQSLTVFKNTLCDECRRQTSITTITNSLVAYVDALLIDLFHRHHLDENGHFCLLAIGGYGRRELQLHSDIDLLLLHDENLPLSLLHHAEALVQDGWDVGLRMSAQIMTVEAMASLASQDVSVLSRLLDMHLLCGRASLMEDVLLQTHPLHLWPSHDYFFAKRQELKKRHEKYGETAYNLEPNVKYGPGGLRDIQLLLHVSKRHFGIKKRRC